MNFRSFIEAIEGLVPGIWYHGTDFASANLILHDGYLRPRQETGQKGATGLPSSVDTNVYLTQNVKTAVIAAYWKARYHELGKGAYIFTVTANDLNKIQVDEDFAYFVITNNQITQNIPETIKSKILKLARLSKSEKEAITKNHYAMRDKLIDVSKEIVNRLTPKERLTIVNTMGGLAHIGKLPFSECWFVPWVIQPQPNYLHANDAIKTRQDLEEYGERINAISSNTLQQ